jgi:hypothetical protein
LNKFEQWLKKRAPIRARGKVENYVTPTRSSEGDVPLDVEKREAGVAD